MDFVGDVRQRLEDDGVVVLEPCDVTQLLTLLGEAKFESSCCMLDPWYNKGVGGVRDDYVEYVSDLLELGSRVAPHLYFWGFPEIVARFVDRLPDGTSLAAWLTWYYKNNPSVIRGWRSAQMACLHITRPDAVMHPEHFLNEAQAAKLQEGKLRYIPGPTSVVEGYLDVIEEALLVGFIKKSEQTGHPSQKPAAVYEKLALMATVEGQLIVDPMCGSGTTGAVARSLGRKALLADISEEYVQICEKRLGIERVRVPQLLRRA